MTDSKSPAPGPFCANDALGKLLGMEPAAVKTAAKWTLAGLLVPVGAALLVAGGLIFVVVHFLAKWR